VKAIVLGVLFGLLFGASTVYLGLRAGLTVSASIPIAVPAASAQRVVDLVIASGIKAVLNFSPGTLQVPPDVKLKSVDLTVSLESLSFYLARGDSEEP